MIIKKHALESQGEWSGLVRPTFHRPYKNVVRQIFIIKTLYHTQYESQLTLYWYNSDMIENFDRRLLIILFSL